MLPPPPVPSLLLSTQSDGSSDAASSFATGTLVRVVAGDMINLIGVVTGRVGGRVHVAPTAAAAAQVPFTHTHTHTHTHTW